MTTFESRLGVIQDAEVITGMPPGYEGLGEYSGKPNWFYETINETGFPGS